MLQTIKRFLVVAVLGVFTFMQSAQAALIGTDQVIAADAAQQNRAKIAAALAQPEVIAQLEQMGVSKTEAQARVAALTDDEAATLAGEIDKLPAGGDGWAWVGGLLAIFLILVLTDWLGWTHIFPWSKSKQQQQQQR